MPISQNLCEYYFDSQVERIYGDAATIRTPKIYFERNLNKPELPYRLYAVVEEWLPDAGGARNAPYDKVVIYYEQGAVDCAAVVANPANQKNKRIFQWGTHATDNKVRDAKKDDNVLLIQEATRLNPAGAGCIEMYNGPKCVARFYFGINSAFRKKIYYTIDVRAIERSVVLTFECKSAIQGSVYVQVLGHEERLPCLTADRENCKIGEPLELTFERGSCVKCIKLPNSIAKSSTRKIFVSLEEEYEDMFVLENKHNETITEYTKAVTLSASYTCPFCHGPIVDVAALEKSREYKNGAIKCNASKGTQKKIEVHDGNKGLKRKCIICQEEFEGDTLKGGTVHKLLPEDFLSHKNFKIAFQGAPRAGKTTYISRFFGLKSVLKESGKGKLDQKPNDFDFSMSMSEIKHSMKKFGVVVDCVQLTALTTKADSVYTSGSWLAQEKQYVDRGMEIGRAIPATEHRDYTGFPFVVEVGGKNYVSFYDIAGETSRQSNEYIKKIAEHDETTIGIFFLITATNDRGNSINQQVAEQLRSAGKYLSPKCPVAVILTKMDAIGDRFDSSCACRRFDYFPTQIGGKFVYDGSDVEKFINESSEEIKSFIESEGGVDIEQQEERSSDSRRFTNVKYFAISSFGFPESTYRDGDNIDDPSYMRFGTSVRRMELPFLWMIRQFNIIK